MGNCLRTPEDHTSLLPISSTDRVLITVPSNSTSTSSDTSIPKVVNRSIGNSAIPTDMNLIKAAQCRNLFEHLPLIYYNEKTIKQTE
jgi:hypothetical protein